MEFQEYIMPELLVLIPVLYLIGSAIKKSNLSDNLIPVLLGVTSIVLCGVWVLATAQLGTRQEVATAIFTAITQGILIAGASVYVNQLIKQAEKDEQ